MPVYMVSVNSYDGVGRKLAMPELIGLMPVTDGKTAIAATLRGDPIDVRDVDVEILSGADGCWSVSEPELEQ